MDDDASVTASDILGFRIVGTLGPAAARELLDVLTRPDADRTALIGRLYSRADARWLAEVLTDLEVDELARLQVVEALRNTPP